MKKSFKRLTSVILAMLLLMTSFPLTAFAVDLELNSLNNAIYDYEDKMDGTVYTNLKDAYNYYVTARELQYAYTYGNRTDLDLADAADNLSSATSQMKAWNAVNVTSPKFTYGNDVESSYIGNIIYRSSPEVFGGLLVEGFKYKFIMPQYVVALYDGNNDIKFPVMVAANNDGVFAGNDRAPLSFYPNDNTAGSLSDNEYFNLPNQWKGYKQVEISGGPTTATQFDWSSANSGSDKIFGYNNESNSQCDNDNNRGEKIKTNQQKVWREYSNYLIYNNSAYSKNWTNGLQTVALSWTGRSMRWINFISGETKINDYHYYYGTADSANRFAATIYVIDYSKVRSTLNTNAKKLLDLEYDKDSKIAGKYYIKHELDSVLDYFESLESDPTVGFNDSNYESRASSVASSITNNINNLNNANVNTSVVDDYAALADAITDYKAIYNQNNSDGKYTADSYAAFKTAYEASVAEAGTVAENGFTTATTADTLIAAYKALNVVIGDNGTSGDTSYTFDSETGTVTITGPGSMADYESGDESPFGNNDEITNIVISDDVTHIGNNVFNGCKNLKKITVPATLTYGAGAFDGCNSLEEVIIVKGEIKKESAKDAPWKQPSVDIIRLGDGSSDISLTKFENGVFTSSENTAFYVYNPECKIPEIGNASFGTNPTIYGYEPSSARDYAEKFGYLTNNFVSLGHEHIWILDDVIAASCTTSGYSVYKCKYCGTTKTDDFVNAIGHNYSDSEVIPPTCTERGYTVKKCSVCGYEKKSSFVAALGHSFDESNYLPDYATGQVKDESSSVIYRHKTPCIRDCGEYQTKYCSFTITGTEIQDAQNFIIFTCSTCGGTYKIKSDAKADEYNVFYFGANNQLKHIEIVKAGQYPSEVPELTPETPGHKYEWQLNNVEVNPSEIQINSITAFQEVENVETFTVSYYDVNNLLISSEEVIYGESPVNVPELPGEVENANDNGHYIFNWKDGANPVSEAITENTEYYIVKSLTEHNFVTTLIDSPTCTEQGAQSKYCEICGYSISMVPIDALGHTIVTDAAVSPTCKVKGKSEGQHCSVCGEIFVAQKEIPLIAHTWDEGIVTVQPTITLTGTKVYTCKVCGETKSETLPKATVKEITPSNKEADKAPVNKTIKKPSKIKTVSLSKKKQLKITFSPIAGAQNYRVQYRKAGAKKWTYAWTNGKTVYFLKNLKPNGLYEFMFAAYKKNSKGNWERGAYSNITRRYYFKHAIKSAKPGKQKITLKWKKNKNATSYQILYSTKKNMSVAKKITINNPKTVSYTLKKLKKGKTYYIRIRANKKYNKKTYIGEYSKRIKVKVSK